MSARSGSGGRASLDAGDERRRERRGLAAAQHVGGRGQRRDGGDLHRVDERRLSPPRPGHDQVAQAGPAGALGDGEGSGRVAQLATERQLAEHGPGVERAGGDLAAGGEHGQRQSGVEPGADLAQEGRCEVGRDPRLWEFKARVLDGRAHPVARFAYGGVAEADDRERRQAGANVDLDPDLAWIDAVDGEGDDAREHA